MFINNDLLEFFGSMMEIKKQKRDIFYTLASDVDDSEIKKTLLRISMDEQRHVDQLQHSIDLVNGVHVTENDTAYPLPELLPTPPKPAREDKPKHVEPVQHIVESAQSIPEYDLDNSFARPVQSKTPLKPAKVDEPKYAEPVRKMTEPSKDIPTYDSGNRYAQTDPIPAPSRYAGVNDEIPVVQTRTNLDTAKDEGYETISHTPSPTTPTLHNMNTLKHPLGEVFGYTTTDQSPKAQRYRLHRHCPFNNKVPNCTNDQSKNPLGVCSILTNNKPVITCPVRFREDWQITDDAASFFFKEGVRWSTVTDVPLNDAYGKSAGNIDVMLVAYDESGKMIDFGALEVHAAFISGNLRDPFEYYMKDPKSHAFMDWTTQPNYPQPDFLSATRRSIVPQLLFKGGILNAWHKKMAVAINKNLFDTLPPFSQVKKEDADIAWLIYDLEPVTEGENSRYQLTRIGVVYTAYQSTLSSLAKIAPGNVNDFVKLIPELAN